MKTTIMYKIPYFRKRKIFISKYIIPTFLWTGLETDCSSMLSLILTLLCEKICPTIRNIHMQYIITTICIANIFHFKPQDPPQVVPNLWIHVWKTQWIWNLTSCFSESNQVFNLRLNFFSPVKRDCCED